MTHDQMVELTDDQLEDYAFTDSRDERLRLSHEIFEEMNGNSP